MANKELRAEIVKNGEGEVNARMVAYSAPLPPASEFEKYEAVLPGAADRIIKLAENQSKHRRFIEKVVVIADSLKSIGGLVAALTIALAGIVCGVYLILKDKPTEGLASLISPLALLVGAFIYQQIKKKGKGDE